jgi:hypothetical protein
VYRSFESTDLQEEIEMANDNAELDIITLEFDDDSKIDCEILGIFEYEGTEYIALLPLDDSEDVYIYGYKEGEDSFELLDIEDDALFEKVAAELESILNEAE